MTDSPIESILDLAIGSDQVPGSDGGVQRPDLSAFFTAARRR